MLFIAMVITDLTTYLMRQVLYPFGEIFMQPRAGLSH